LRFVICIIVSEAMVFTEEMRESEEVLSGEVCGGGGGAFGRGESGVGAVVAAIILAVSGPVPAKVGKEWSIDEVVAAKRLSSDGIKVPLMSAL